MFVQWRPEHIKQALEYAAFYDAEIYKKANLSIITYLDEEVIHGSSDTNSQSRAIELLGYIAQQKSQIEWAVNSEKCPREIEIIGILIDTLLDPNNSIHTKALQSLHTIGNSSNTAGNILRELIANCRYQDDSIEFPFDRPTSDEVLYDIPASYSFQGHETITDQMLELPQRVYSILYSKSAHTKRVALCFIEFMVKLNKRIIFTTDFCRELSRLNSDASVIVTRQAMQTIDSILTTFPSCYAVVWTWCELFTAILNNPDERNDALAREYFKKKILDNIVYFDGNKSPEHQLCWEIIKTMVEITSRIYFQNNISRLMSPNMISSQLINMTCSHIDQKNKYLALIVLNLICPFSSNNLDAIVNLVFSNNLFYVSIIYSTQCESTNEFRE